VPLSSWTTLSRSEKKLANLRSTPATLDSHSMDTDDIEYWSGDEDATFLAVLHDLDLGDTAPAVAPDNPGPHPPTTPASEPVPALSTSPAVVRAHPLPTLPSDLAALARPTLSDLAALARPTLSDHPAPASDDGDNVAASQQPLGTLPYTSSHRDGPGVRDFGPTFPPISPTSAARSSTTLRHPSTATPAHYDYASMHHAALSGINTNVAMSLPSPRICEASANLDSCPLQVSNTEDDIPDGSSTSRYACLTFLLLMWPSCPLFSPGLDLVSIAMSQQPRRGRPRKNWSQDVGKNIDVSISLGTTTVEGSRV
jgi:hypothetical protein